MASEIVKKIIWRLIYFYTPILSSKVRMLIMENAVC